MKLSSQRGFTIIEIMIALTIGAFLLSGIFQIFVSLKYTDRLSVSLSRVQEASRTAIDIMAKDIRMIGYKGCADPSVKENVNIIAKNSPTTDFLETSLRGFDVTSNGWAVAPDDDLATIDGAGIKKARLNSDVISIMRASEESSTVNDHNNLTANIKVDTNPQDLKQDDVAILSDCESMDIFRISNAQKDNSTSEHTFTHASGTNTNPQLSKVYSSDSARLFSFISNTYFVGDTGRTNLQGDKIYALYRLDSKGDVNEIVEGVENVQLMYGQEFANGFHRSVNASDANLNMLEVTSIKLSILAAGNERVLENDDTFYYQVGDRVFAPAASGNALTYPNDRRLRKVFNMTINVRNRRVGL